jgi:hypothetical protein
MSYGPISHRLVADENDETFNMEIESVHSKHENANLSSAFDKV